MAARPRKGTSASRRSGKADVAFAALVDTDRGQAALIDQGTAAFSSIALSLFGPKMLLDQSHAAVDGRRNRATVPYASVFGKSQTTAYQWLTGTVLPSLRQRLLPDPDDFVAILDRVDFYDRHVPWINRGLVIRSGLNASEFRIDSPGQEAQQEWMLDVKRRLRMFSFMREFFWGLRAYGQVVTLWKTSKRGRDPVSIECANPRVYQPRFNPLDGSDPRIVVVPANNEALARYAMEAKSSDSEAARRAAKVLSALPDPIRDALNVDMSAMRVEIPAEELEPFGYHFEYASLDRRHWEDWGFPGMYSIFPYLEMLMLSDDVDVNALHHYKAGILLVRLGPSEPRAGDEALIPGESELKAIDKKLVEMVKARLPGWSARGDLRIDWVVPPEHIMNPDKVASAKEKVFDWLGIPQVAWAGQSLKGAFASAMTTLKFLQQESLDERQIATELFERWFNDRSKATNAFKGAVWPKVRFDPNALLEPRIVLDLVRAFLTSGGADMQTIAEAFGYDAEVWLSRKENLKTLKKKYKTDFDPEYIPQKGTPSSAPKGRPTTVNQPTPDRSTGLPQPRPGAQGSWIEEAAEISEREFGISRDEFSTVMREGFTGRDD